MLPPRQALRRAEPAAKEVLAALLREDYVTLASRVHPGRGLLLRAGASDPCLNLARLDVERCTDGARPVHCESDPYLGPDPAACSTYLNRLLHLEWFAVGDELSTTCTSTRQYVVMPELLPTNVEGQPVPPLVIVVYPREGHFPNNGLVLTFVEEGGRLWLHELTPAEVPR